MAKKHGHHGGAWKVAYADFVTAMMALFLVLWLTSQDEKIKEAVERSFRNPYTSLTKDSAGLIPNKDMFAVRTQKGNFDSASVIELAMLRKLNQELSASLQDREAQNDSIKIDVVADEMRINIFDRARKPIFEAGSKEFTSYGKMVLTTLAWGIARYKNFSVEVEGHTEKGFAEPGTGYDEWEVSTSRANTSRRLLIDNGVDRTQIKKIAGFGDTQPMTDIRPEDQANRRVTVLLRANSNKQP